jgi:DNA-binding response OmpR family regulator
MKNVVIIEDDRTILEMYTLKFSSEGYGVFTAKNGEEGLKVLHGTKADVVLLDIMMPIMDGVTMLKKLRETSWGKNLPVFILTNVSEDEAPQALQSLNIAGYIIKANATPQQVLHKIEKYLK